MEAIPLARLDFLLGHVAERNLVLGHFELDVKRSLEVGFVETRKGAAGVASFELGAKHVVELVVLGYRRRDFALGLVLGAVETSHDIVDSALELDLQHSLASVGDTVSKVQRNLLPLLIVAEVFGRVCLVASLQLGTLELELVCIENEGAEAVILCNLCVDLDGAMVAKLAAEFEVVEGEVVVRGLGPIKQLSASHGSDNGRNAMQLTNHAGRTSRSEAMFAKLLVTSL